MPTPRLGIRARLLLIGLIAAIPALFLVYQAGREEQRLAREQLQAEAVATAQQAAHAQRRKLTQARAPLTILSELPEVRGDQAACTRVLGTVQAHTPYYLNLGVIGADGLLQCSVLPFTPPLDLSQRRYFQEALETADFAVGGYQIGALSGLPSLHIAYPLEVDDIVVGVIFAAVDLLWLAEPLADVQLPEGGRLTVVDADHRALAQFPPEPEERGESLPEAAALRAQLDGRQAGVLETGGDEDRVYAFTLVEGGADDGLLLYASLPAAGLDATAQAVQQRNLLTLGITLFLILAAVVLAGQLFVVRPVQQLARATRRLGRGELDTRSRLADDGTELGELARNFDAMAANLQTHTGQLQQQSRQIQRLNRVYAMLSGINNLILRTTRADDLLHESCRLAVSTGGLPLAWAVRFAAGERRIEQRWCAGSDGPSRHFLLPDEGLLPARGGLLTPVLDEARAVVYPEPANDPNWPAATRAELTRRGYRGCLLLPLCEGERVVGCLGLYAYQADAFDRDELRLLQDLASNISLGLTHIGQASRLAFLAHRDPLTELPNREVLLDRLQQALSALEEAPENGHSAVLSVALDGLRGINSVHGHAAGDSALRAAARRIYELLPTTATLARIGNSRFAILLPRASADEAASCAEGLLQTFRLPFQHDELNLYLGVRIGISVAPEDGRAAAPLLQHAETAVTSLLGRSDHYRFYTVELQHRTSRRLSLEHALRHALEHEQFHLLYQPVVGIESRRLEAVEALLRWEHPTLGDLGPAQFVPVAEAAGLIAPIGEWALQEACRQACEWARAGTDGFKVAVNVSVDQLRQRGFVRDLERTLQRSGVQGGRLDLGLEITESELMEDADAAVALLGELRDLGIALSIDDFGTGYSSLAYLKRFPVDTLKIDIAFVRDLNRDPANRSIIQAIIVLAQHLQLATIAEGVERPDQLTTLAELGCRAAQGYLLSRPASAAQIPALARRRFDPYAAS